MRAELLDVIGVVANPLLLETRIRLAQQWIEHMLESGVRLTVVECALGRRSFVLNDDPRYQHVAVRARTLAWNKESLINIALGRLRDDWEYALWSDADLYWRSPSWAADTVHALQQYQIVQPWSDAYDLGPRGEHIDHHVSFCRLWSTGQQIRQGPRFHGQPYRFGHPGYAWAARREFLEGTGGLIDTAALGAADHHMALALIGRVMETVPANLCANYSAPLLRWQDRALRVGRQSIGCVWGTIEHQFHGPKRARGYIPRWEILHKHGFDPTIDLFRNLQGVVEFANKPLLQRDVDRYYRSRREDSNDPDLQT